MIPALPALSFFFISLAIGPNFGYFNGDFGPIILITGAFILFLIDRISKLYHWNIVPLEHSLIPSSSLCLITFAAYLFYMWGQWIKNAHYFDVIHYFSYFLFFVICYLLALRSKNEKLEKIIFLSLLGAAFIIRILVLQSSPSPALDVFVILKEAPVKLLSGINPYNTLYTYVFPGITPDYYAYWPAAILLQIPFIGAFRDPRVLLIVADIAAAFFLYLIAGRTLTGIFLSLTYLFRPQSLYILEGSWLTPLNFFFVILLFYTAKKIVGGNNNVTIKQFNNLTINGYILVGIILGILTSIQFFHAVIFFFLAKYLNWSKKFMLVFIVTVGIFIIPFLIISPSRFINQTVLVYFQSLPHPSILIHTSLSLNTLFWAITKTDIPSFILYPLILGIFFFLLMKQKQKLSGVLANITLFFLAVFLFGKQAFVNYYYFIGSLLILYLAISPLVKENK